MEAAITEKNSLSEKLVAVSKERDDAVGELKKFKEAQKDLDKLITEYTNLMTKLASAAPGGVAADVLEAPSVPFSAARKPAASGGADISRVARIVLGVAPLP